MQLGSLKSLIRVSTEVIKKTNPHYWPEWASDSTWTQQDAVLLGRHDVSSRAFPSVFHWTCLQPCLPASWLNSKLASAGSCMWLVSACGRWLKRRECCIWKAAWGGSSEWSGNTIWESGSPAAARCVRPTVWMVKSAKTALCLLL